MNCNSSPRGLHYKIITQVFTEAHAIIFLEHENVWNFLYDAAYLRLNHLITHHHLTILQVENWLKDY